MTEKRYTETVRKLKGEKLQIRFSETVCRDFGRLHEALKDKEEFNYDTLRHLEDLSNPELKREIPVAFAAVSEIFQEVALFAANTKNTQLSEALEQLQSDISGYGDERTPLTIVSVSPHR